MSLESSWESAKSRTWDEWAVSYVLAKASWNAAKFVGWRRPVRAGVSGARGTAHFGRAAGLTFADFIRGQKLGNKPFGWEPYVAPGMALGLYGSTPFGMIAAAVVYPEIAGPQQQSAATGQPGIGSAGHGLIYGNMSWSDIWPFGKPGNII